MTFRLRAFATLATASFAGACASSGAGSDDSVCESPRSMHARSLTEYVDSVAFVRELGQWGPATGLTLARISADSAGAPSATIASEALDAAGRERLADMLERHTRVTPDARDPVAVEIGTWDALAPRRLDDLQQCRPVMLDVTELRRYVGREAQRLDVEEAHARMSIMLFVEPDGTVGEARVYESSGRIDVDGAMLDVFRRATFSPSRMEGVPVGVWVMFPVTVSVQPPPAPPMLPPPGF